MALGVLGRDHDGEMMAQRQDVKRQVDRGPALRRDDPEGAPRGAQRIQQPIDPLVGGEQLGRVLVIPGAVDAQQLLGVLVRERPHLVDERPPTFATSRRIRELLPQNLADGVPMRFADERDASITVPSRSNRTGSYPLGPRHAVRAVSPSSSSSASAVELLHPADVGEVEVKWRDAIAPASIAAKSGASSGWCLGLSP